MPYPTAFPMLEGKYLVSVLTGGTKPVLKDLHAAIYEVWGYAAGQFFGNETPVWGENLVSDLDYNACKTLLAEEVNGACHQFAIPGVVAAAGVDWKKWIDLFLRILPLILKESP